MKAKDRALCLVFSALSAAGAHAQSASTGAGQAYPVKPVRLVVANAPGGSDDQHGRMLAQKLTDSFGQQFIVDNRSGTGGLIARTFVAKSAADGYTLLLGAASMAISQHLAAKPLGDPQRDFAPISLVAKTHSVLLVHPSIPAKTVKEKMSGWYGVFAPAGTPGEIIASLNAALVKQLAAQPLREALIAVNSEPRSSTPAELAKLLAEDIERYRRIVKLAGIEPQ